MKERRVYADGTGRTMETVRRVRAPKKALILPEPGKKFVMLLRSVGNPDFGQYAPISEPAAISGDSLAAMVRGAEEYIQKWDLGGGNWPETEIRDTTGATVAWMSYNGRLWARKHDHDSEIKVEG